MNLDHEGKGSVYRARQWRPVRQEESQGDVVSRKVQESILRQECCTVR